ncbi:hypothetical protein [Nesterenkonia jeotgali]|uniref:Uncharacterized protein n=1 Tax=Nesterenkonia jeotgali TaxID=317018 RepID=A0A839FGA4_9MICC|nr:hypothetical protein [Nesterenkonia jeotgali]MBA8920730.1 hypothetical protein [Nesterenkonia jeotgali]
MTAENTEPNDAPGGADLRARYLPVSRKELRRRREAGIADEPRPTQAQEAPSDAQADAQTDAPVDSLTAEESPAAEDSATTSAPEESGTAEGSGTEADSEVVADPEGEPDSAADGGGEADSEADSETDADAEAQTDAESGSVPTFTTGSESTFGPAPGAPAPWGFSLPSPPASEPAVPTKPALPAGSALLAETSEQGSEDAATEPATGSGPGGTSEEVLEDGQAEPAEFFGSEEIEGPEDRAETDPAEDELSAEPTEDEDPAEATEGPAEGAEVDAAATVETGSPASQPAHPRPQDLPGTDLDDQDEAPVPASRKSRRGLQVTENIAELSADKLAELQEINEAVAAADDPHRVDPELLKKQQALAARAMQANQERLRKEQVAADRDAKERRRRLRPESEVITRKALRAHMESDETAEPSDYATGSIEPIQARGAHGLEIDAMVEHSTRQGARQSMMGWLVIILAVLLVIALGVVLSFIL